MTDLTHIGSDGSARMVDVGDKPDSQRVATAEARITMKAATLSLILEGQMPKGDVIATARLAGIMAAKRTSDLIPLCHPLPLSAVTVDIEPEETGLHIVATVRTHGKTGVEMEALTAASVAALTLYDMAKAVEKGMEISDVRLVSKSGGQRGDYRRQDP